jgi:hypothetical protein
MSRPVPSLHRQHLKGFDVLAACGGIRPNQVVPLCAAGVGKQVMQNIERRLPAAKTSRRAVQQLVDASILGKPVYPDVIKHVLLV